jgi:CRP/FNR family cyclic AMP-dependent transcriptional regulator
VACDADLLKLVPLFSLLDADERAVLAAHVEVRQFDPHQRIYRRGDAGGSGYVLIRGKVRITLIDDDQQELVVDEPEPGGFFGFASLLDGTPHQTSALVLDAVTCLEIDREDLRQLLHKKPDSGMDMLAVLGRQFHAAQRLVQMRSIRNSNEVIEQQATLGDRISDAVARFGGSWRFIITFGVLLMLYTAANSYWPVRPGIRIRLSCSTSFSPCWRPFKRRLS